MKTLEGIPVSRGIAIGKMARFSKPSVARHAFRPSSPVLVTNSLSIVDVESLSLNRFCGLILQKGGPASHIAIMARTMDIPAVFGVTDIMRLHTKSPTLIVDGTEGRIIIDPDESTLARYEDLHRRYCLEAETFRRKAQLPAFTLDGCKVEVCANVGVLSDIDSAISMGADGVGVFTTELLYMNRKYPPT